VRSKKKIVILRSPPRAGDEESRSFPLRAQDNEVKWQLTMTLRRNGGE